MKQEFIDFLNALMQAAPQVVEEKMTDNVKAYIDAISDVKIKTDEVTEKGLPIISFMQGSPASMFKARDIADTLGVSSRGVSGTLRKLVNDGYVDKIGIDPIVYSLTEKGRNYKVD